jgi:hypothetical protein
VACDIELWFKEGKFGWNFILLNGLKSLPSTDSSFYARAALFNINLNTLSFEVIFLKLSKVVLGF